MGEFGRACGAVLLAGMMLAPAAQAQYRDERVGRIGNVDILRVWEGGRFDRCFAQVPAAHGAFRLFWNVGRDYVFSAPAVGTGRGLHIAISTPRGMIHTTGSLRNERTVFSFDQRDVEKLMSVRGRFTVDVQGTIFPYTLQGTTMEDVFVTVENCAHRNQR